MLDFAMANLTAWAGTGALVVGILVFLSSWFLWNRIRTLYRLLDGAKEGDGPAVLAELARRNQLLEKEVESLRSRCAALEQKSVKSLSGVGLVRYDAFSDVGGRQSFSLALESEEGTGVVVTAIVGRGDVRVYGKAIENGACPNGLTSEEIQALEQARQSRGFLG
jgi:hypothetical protein